MGRPKNPERTTVLNVRMSVSLHRIAKQNSKKAGFSSVGAYVRALLIANEPITLRDISPEVKKFVYQIRKTCGYFETLSRK